MKKEIVFKCENPFQLQHVTAMLSQLVSLSQDRSEGERKLYTTMNIILLIAGWSDDPNLIPEDTRIEMENLAKRHAAEVKRLRKVSFVSSEFNSASMRMVDEEAPYVSRFFKNESIYPCLVTAMVDDSQKPGSRIKMAIQTAESAGVDLLEHVNRIFDGVPALWDAIFACEPYVFIKMINIHLRDRGTYASELFASLGTILKNRTKPADLSDRMYTMVYVPFLIEAYRECQKHVMQFMTGMLDKLTGSSSDDSAENSEDKED